MLNRPTGSGSPPDPERLSAPVCEASTAPASSAEIIAFPPGKTVSAKSIQLNLPKEGGHGGEGGSAAPVAPVALTNRQFAETVFAGLPDGARPLVTAKRGDPSEGPWTAHDGSEIDRICTANLNTYVNCASFLPNDDGSLAATKAQVAAYHFLLLDDVGTKVDASRVAALKPTWRIETSPGNFQVGYKLRKPLIDPQAVTCLLDRIADAGLTDKGAKGINRWARLPNGINGKAKHLEGAVAFACKLFEWNAEVSYSAEELLDGLAPHGPSSQPVEALPRPTSPVTANGAGDEAPVYVAKPARNAVVEELKVRKLYKRALGGGKHDVTCPWIVEHTEGLDTGACYFEPDAAYPFGGFRCLHSHGDDLHVSHLLDYLGVELQAAKHRPLIRATSGQLHTIVRAAEHVLSEQPEFYQAGNAIVRVRYDKEGEPTLEAVDDTALTLALGEMCDWTKFDGRKGTWVVCDPPEKAIRHLLQAKPYRCLRELEGFARQPFYRSNGGRLVFTAGYDEQSRRLAVFDTAKYALPDPTREAANNAMVIFDELLGEFHFASDADRAAALSAILTAIVRGSLETAPAFHVTAPSPGSGKSLLCNVIARMASKSEPLRLPYPRDATDAEKVIFASLLTQPPTIMFDDMTDDWKAHGVINSALTASSITGRILGVSKTATVSTRILFLGSGNNVGPVQDLSRRVLTINLNAHSESPATLAYKGDPMAALQVNRERYVVAGLTIIEAYKAAGSPRTDVLPIASYNGGWATHCRHPLIWLGMPDPASVLIEQVREDPTLQPLRSLFETWYEEFGERPTKVSELLAVNEFTELHDALQDLPIAYKGHIDPTSLGKYLTKNKNRPVGAYILEEGPRGKRRTWCIRRTAVTSAAPKPPLPP